MLPRLPRTRTLRRCCAYKEEDIPTALQLFHHYRTSIIDILPTIHEHDSYNLLTYHSPCSLSTFFTWPFWSLLMASLAHSFRHSFPIRTVSSALALLSTPQRRPPTRSFDPALRQNPWVQTPHPAMVQFLHQRLRIRPSGPTLIILPSP